MVQSKSKAVMVALVCSLLVLGTSARADNWIPITDATYWHHAIWEWDPDPNGLAVIVFFKDPDPARAYTGEWWQWVGDCTYMNEPGDMVAGRFPRYEPGRLSGRGNPGHGSGYQLNGVGVEVWIFRSADFQEAQPFPLDGSLPAWCTQTASTDSSGNDIFEFRRAMTHLQSFPRIARGTLDFEFSNAETPGGHFRMEGIVHVEHDPDTLAPLSTSGRFEYWSSIKRVELSLIVDK